MKDPDPSAPIDACEFWTQLASLEDGSMPNEQRDALMLQLEQSASARRLYAEYFRHSEGLAAEARYLEERGRLPTLHSASPPSRLFVRSLLVAAALLVISATIASLVMLKRPAPQVLSAATSADARWSINGTDQDPNTKELTIASGATVEVFSGTLKLKGESGAVMILQGPAKATFPELHRPELKHGWFWLDSGESQDPFEVLTPELIVRDIGTRFGVRVPEQGPAEVHLIEGKVEILDKNSGEMITAFEPSQQGLLISASGEPMPIPLARDPFPELEALLADTASYATTIQSQNPTGYWRIGEARMGRLTNEITGGTTGGRPQSIRILPEGPSPTSGFQGFGKDNRAAALPGGLEGAAISLGVTPIHRGLLFQEDFNGDGSPLHDTTPAQTSKKARWIACPSFRSDGTIVNGLGSATLAFEPFNGCLYTLDASFNEIIENGEHWLALGFANGQSPESSRFNRFVEGSPEGRAWILARGPNATYPNMTFTRGTGDAAEWEGPLSVPSGDDLDLRIVLDTTKGAGKWTATWYAKRQTESQYTCVRPQSPVINEMIRSIGIAASGGSIAGSISHLSLRAEPTPDLFSGDHLADGRVQLPRREGAVSFWVRRPPKDGSREILWSAGDDPSDISMQASLEADGRVAFFMENGRYDVLMTSRRRIDDDRWHHLVVTWSPSAVDLYLDDTRVARDADGRSLQQGVLSELRFGCGPMGSANAAFEGLLDEIAIWDRPLDAVEVQHQFHSAKGK